jgi:cell division protease FtsH
MILSVFVVALLQLFSGANTFQNNRKAVGFNKPFSLQNTRRYPISKYGREHYLRQLNSRNITEKENAMFSQQNIYDPMKIEEMMNNSIGTRNFTTGPTVRIIIGRNGIGLQSFEETDDYDEDEDEDEKAVAAIEEMYVRQRNRMMAGGGNRGVGGFSDKPAKSENFEVIKKSPINFADVGGYDSIKQELEQCVDLLKNHTKYSEYNVRVPRGLIFEGPPGNGKTLLAKALAGEAKTGFIAVSGAEFQEKYVGVGSSRIRELFKLAKDNIPCIVFIDEIDALGRKRSGDGETASSERDSTLNELLVAMDGFKNASGIFIIGATNRADLLDPALVRPGRIDKRVYIGNPDEKTRKAILAIHLNGKPHDKSIVIDDLVEVTNGLSAAQIENLVNEAMLNALKTNQTQFTVSDIDIVVNRMMVGWQPNEHQFTANIIDSIAIHEMGHAIVGLLSKHHSKMTKVIINLQAPQSPGYTVFETSSSTIFTREALFEHLMILLAGRIAEEIVFDVSVSTGAIGDFEEALKLAQKMVVYYGMGKNVIYPSMSEKYKEMIDEEVAKLIHDAYGYAEFILRNSKDLMQEGAELLKRDKLLKADTLVELMNTKYTSVLSLKYNGNR